VTLGDGVVTVPVPKPWKTELDDEGFTVHMFTSKGDYIQVSVISAEPTDEATAALSKVIENSFSTGYSQLETTEITPGEPYGSLVSTAGLDYRGVFTDNQTSLAVEGFMLFLVRQDTQGLFVWVEGPQGTLEARESVWAPVSRSATASFAGA